MTEDYIKAALSVFMILFTQPSSSHGLDTAGQHVISAEFL